MYIYVCELTVYQYVYCLYVYMQRIKFRPETEQMSSNHGGQRPGAGRPKKAIPRPNCDQVQCPHCVTQTSY